MSKGRPNKPHGEYVSHSRPVRPDSPHFFIIHLLNIYSKPHPLLPYKYNAWLTSYFHERPQYPALAVISAVSDVFSGSFF